MSIGFSAIKVTQHLMLGMNYLLQSSPDLVNWTPTGPSFTATNETIVSEFEINLTNRYFRILSTLKGCTLVLTYWQRNHRYPLNFNDSKFLVKTGAGKSNTHNSLLSKLSTIAELGVFCYRY